MHAGIHNFELHAFRAAFQMVLNDRLVLLSAFVVAFQMLRLMSGHIKQDRIRNVDIKEEVGAGSIMEKIVKSRLRWFNHVVCVEKTCKIPNKESRSDGG